MFEDLPCVVVAEAAAHTDACHPLRLQENLLKVRDCDLESLVAGNLRLAFQEALKIYIEFIKAHPIHFLSKHIYQ